MPIDWNDPEARFHLIERVGPEEYTRLHAEHLRRSTVATVGGHAISPMYSERFGRLFVVGDTGRAFSTLPQAATYARKKPRLVSGLFSAKTVVHFSTAAATDSRGHAAAVCTERPAVNTSTTPLIPRRVCIISSLRPIRRDQTYQSASFLSR
jgi:hypothetical protein